CRARREARPARPTPSSSPSSRTGPCRMPCPRRRASGAGPRPRLREREDPFRSWRNSNRPPGAVGCGQTEKPGGGMKGDAEILKVLQDVLSAELTAINQYFIHARMLRNWRYMRLADHMEKESIGEMKHAQEAIDRILYLDGVPNMQKYMKINVGKSVPDMMRVEHNLELDAVTHLNR